MGKKKKRKKLKKMKEHLMILDTLQEIRKRELRLMRWW